ncbi:MAG: galactose-1-epimerase, partial [Planctomycetes bacterium]|nr:galactose-1-epimerase [Planctomycetota bacterium]
DGRFTLDGVEYVLAKNDGNNHLHGGIKGFNKVIWNAEPIESGNSVGVKLEYLSKDGEENYPGNLKVTVVYTLTSSDELKIEYEARTDKKTVLNLTNHSYYNLAGAGSGDILNHKLTINADSYTEINDELSPTGRIQPVGGTVLDFTDAFVIGDRIAEVKGGYDHNYVLNKEQGGELSFAAKVIEPVSGRSIEIFTTEPGIQLYTGNFLDALAGKGGSVYNKHDAFCLEAQHYPDSPNRPNFPSTILEPGQTYRQLTVHRFSSQ